MGTTNPQNSLPLGACGPPSNTYIARLIPLTTTNESSIDSCISTLCNKFPIGYNRTPQIHPPPNVPPFDDQHPHLIPISRPTPLTTPNGTRIQSAVLPQYTFQTDTQTDRPTAKGRRSRRHGPQGYEVCSRRVYICTSI